MRPEVEPLHCSVFEAFGVRKLQRNDRRRNKQL